jgi:hypothetical protein
MSVQSDDVVYSDLRKGKYVQGHPARHGAIVAASQKQEKTAFSELNILPEYILKPFVFAENKAKTAHTPLFQ